MPLRCEKFVHKLYSIKKGIQRNYSLKSRKDKLSISNLFICDEIIIFFKLAMRRTIWQNPNPGIVAKGRFLMEKNILPIF